jgi:hypothetical protein
MTNKLGPVKTNKEITADYIGELKIGDFFIPCAVLSNEERVIFQREFVGLLTGTKKGGLERYLQAKNLEPYLPDKFMGESWDQGILYGNYINSKYALILTARIYVLCQEKQHKIYCQLNGL